MSTRFPTSDQGPQSGWGASSSSQAQTTQSAWGSSVPVARPSGAPVPSYSPPSLPVSIPNTGSSSFARAGASYKPLAGRTDDSTQSGWGSSAAVPVPGATSTSSQPVPTTQKTQSAWGSSAPVPTGKKASGVDWRSKEIVDFKPHSPDDRRKPSVLSSSKSTEISRTDGYIMKSAWGADAQ